jgi:hypothetical protein
MVTDHDQSHSAFGGADGKSALRGEMPRSNGESGGERGD